MANQIVCVLAMGVRGRRMYVIMLPSSDFSVTYGCEGAEDVCDYAAI